MVACCELSYTLEMEWCASTSWKLIEMINVRVPETSLCIMSTTPEETGDPIYAYTPEPRTMFRVCSWPCGSPLASPIAPADAVAREHSVRLRSGAEEPAVEADSLHSNAVRTPCWRPLENRTEKEHNVGPGETLDDTSAAISV